MFRPFSRRELLRRFGLTVGSLPLLDALGNVATAGTPPAKRLVSIVLQHGVFVQHWLPFVPTTLPIATTSPGNMLKAPSQFLQKVAFEQRTGCAAIDLAPYTAALGPIHSAKWQALKSKTAFLNNLSCSNKSVQGHTASAMLGGYKNDDSVPGTANGYNLTGETIDVVIGRKLNGRSPLRLKLPDYIDDARFLEDAVGPTIVRKSDGSGFEMAPFLRDPIKVWDQLFASYVPPVVGPKKREPNDRRSALLERALSSIRQIEADQRLSAYDRQRLDNHASTLEAQRANLATMTVPQPTVQMPPARPTGMPGATTETFNLAKGTMFRAQFANAAAALKMNKEQVITINTGLENEWLTEGLALGGSQAYHGNAGHLANPSDAIIEECRKVQQFVFDAIADFLSSLDTVEDPATGATFLDNTLVVIVPEHDGQPNGHLRGSVPVILAGGFGTFTGGKLYDYSRPELAQASASCTYKGYSYSRLIHTVLGAFGVTAAEQAKMDIQGQANSWNGADLTDWTLPLPGLV